MKHRSPPPPDGIPANVMPGDIAGVLPAPPHGAATSDRPAAGLAARGQPAPAVNAGDSGDDQDAERERLRRRYPQWRIWRGHATGGYRAMRRGHPTARELIGARDIGELACRVTQGRNGMTNEPTAAAAKPYAWAVTLRYALLSCR